jgi:hypothetical protein
MYLLRKVGDYKSTSRCNVLTDPVINELEMRLDGVRSLSLDKPSTELFIRGLNKFPSNQPEAFVRLYHHHPTSNHFKHHASFESIQDCYDHPDHDHFCLGWSHRLWDLSNR